MILIIVGYYGKNLGDLMMLQGIINSISECYDKIIVLSYDNLNLDELDINDRPKIKSYSIHLRIRKKIKLFKLANIIMWGGGSCFNDIDGNGGIKQILLAKLVNPKISVEYYGVGVDIKKNIINRFCLYLALTVSSNFAVRDKHSYDIVKNFRCSKIIEDPIFLNKSWFENIPSAIKGNSLVVSYRCVDKYFPKSSKKYLNSFIKSIASVIENLSYSHVYVLPCDRNVDEQDNRYIVEKLYSVYNISSTYIPSYSLKDFCSVLRSSSMVITGRLHVGIIASLYHKKYLLLNYSEKNKQFTQADNNPDSLIEYNEIFDSNFLLDKCMKL